MQSERVRPTRSTWLRIITPIVAGQGIFAVWLLSLLFYRAGAYFLDAGFYVYAIASGEAPSTPPLVRDAWGDNVFLTHTTISPMLISAVLRPLVGVPFNFIGYLAIQHALLSLAGAVIFTLGGLLYGASRRAVIMLGAAGAVMLPLSNVGLGSLAYPHVEILGSSAVALGVCLLILRWSDRVGMWAGPLGVVSLLVGFLVREDLGGHLAIAVVASMICAGRASLESKVSRRALLLGGGGALVTVVLLLFQRVVMGSDGSFDISYSGEPAYAHITSVWHLVERFSYFIGSRMDLLAGMLVFVLLGLVYRQRLFFAYPLACLPWIILNVTSVDENKHSMGIYGMFPTVIYLTAPPLALTLGSSQSDAPPSADAERSNNTILPLAYLIAGASLLMGGIAGPPNGGGYVYHFLLRYPIVGPGEISLVHQLVEDFAVEGEGTAVDDAVMSLEPVVLQDTQLISRIQTPSAYTSLLFFPNFTLGRPSVRAVFSGWINDGASISISCLPGGLRAPTDSTDHRARS